MALPINISCMCVDTVHNHCMCKVSYYLKGTNETFFFRHGAVLKFYPIKSFSGHHTSWHQLPKCGRAFNYAYKIVSIMRDLHSSTKVKFWFIYTQIYVLLSLFFWNRKLFSVTLVDLWETHAWPCVIQFFAFSNIFLKLSIDIFHRFALPLSQITHFKVTLLCIYLFFQFLISKLSKLQFSVSVAWP